MFKILVLDVGMDRRFLRSEIYVRNRQGASLARTYLFYFQVPGLWEALEDKQSGVSTIFSQDYCEKTWNDLRYFKGGDAIFTYPDTPIKCPGAPQKIAYLADSHFTRVSSSSQITRAVRYY